jgi:hypothetical protein
VATVDVGSAPVAAGGEDDRVDLVVSAPALRVFVCR